MVIPRTECCVLNAGPGAWAFEPLANSSLLVDSFLMAGVYRGLRRQDPSHWWQGAFRKTWLSAAAVIFFFSIAGLALQVAVPEAHSIGAVVRHW